MKTGKTVEKMRKQKEERLEEFKDSRKVWMGDRFYLGKSATATPKQN